MKGGRVWARYLDIFNGELLWDGNVHLLHPPLYPSLPHPLSISKDHLSNQPEHSQWTQLLLHLLSLLHKLSNGQSVSPISKPYCSFIFSFRGAPSYSALQLEGWISRLVFSLGLFSNLKLTKSLYFESLFQSIHVLWYLHVVPHSQLYQHYQITHCTSSNTVKFCFYLPTFFSFLVRTGFWGRPWASL